MPRYCLPLRLDSFSEALRRIEDSAPAYAAIEIWLDHIGDLPEDPYPGLIESAKGRELVCLFRRDKLEAPRMTPERRQQLIRDGDRHGVTFDFDIGTQAEDIEWAIQHAPGTRLIVSYHDYESTPTEAELRGIEARMEALARRRTSPTIPKIAAYCGSLEDCTRLLDSNGRLRAMARSPIVLGMGAHGLATRLVSLVWESYLTFAPETLAEASAPGQLSLPQYLAIVRQLEVSHARK